MFFYWFGLLVVKFLWLLEILRKLQDVIGHKPSSPPVADRKGNILRCTIPTLQVPLSGTALISFELWKVRRTESAWTSLDRFKDIHAKTVLSPLDVFFFTFLLQLEYEVPASQAKRKFGYFY